MKQYKNYLIDWDGCLAKTLEVWLEGYRETFDEFGIHPTDEEITYQFGNLKGPSDLGVDNLDDFISRLMSRMESNLKDVELYPEASLLLGRLKDRGVKIALISSSPGRILKPALRAHSLEDMFDIVLSSDDVSDHKPHPAVIYKALESSAINGRLDESVIIGDSKSDLGAANNAHIDSILMYPDSHKSFYSIDELKSYDPTYIFASFAQFSSKIE